MPNLEGPTLNAIKQQVKTDQRLNLSKIDNDEDRAAFKLMTEPPKDDDKLADVVYKVIGKAAAEYYILDQRIRDILSLKEWMKLGPKTKRSILSDGRLFVA